MNTETGILFILAINGPYSGSDVGQNPCFEQKYYSYVCLKQI